MTAAPGPQQPDEDEQDAPLLVLREGWQDVDPEVTAQDLHAQWHDEPGNLMGKDECGWQCDVWDPIWHMLLAALAAAPAQPVRDTGEGRR